MKYILYVILGMLLWVGCEETEHLTPSTIQEPGYNLPQGDHDFDERIVDWNKRTGIYILYKYDPRDLFFNLGQSWLELKADTMERTVTYVHDGKDIQVMPGYGVQVLMPNGKFTTYYFGEGQLNANGFPYTLVDNGDMTATISETYIETGNAPTGSYQLDLSEEEYIGKQVELLEKYFLQFYTDARIKKSLPFKMMLGKKLLVYESSGSVKVANSYLVSNMLILSHGDQSMDVLYNNVLAKKALKLFWNESIMLNKIYDEIQIRAEAKGFFKISDYQLITDQLKDDNVSVTTAKRSYYKWGIVNWGSFLIEKGNIKTLTLDRMKTLDLKSYLSMIMNNTKANLEKNPTILYWQGNNSIPTGVLSPKMSELTLPKYNIIIAVLNDMGINIQAIGDYK